MNSNKERHTYAVFFFGKGHWEARLVLQKALFEWKLHDFNPFLINVSRPHIPPPVVHIALNKTFGFYFRRRFTYALAQMTARFVWKKLSEPQTLVYFIFFYHRYYTLWNHPIGRHGYGGCNVQVPTAWRKFPSAMSKGAILIARDWSRGWPHPQQCSPPPLSALCIHAGLQK